ncbi:MULTISPECIES: NACHT domain-containing protein [Saccharothrix]|uniref:NACHT domain-containing protein n=1 Tax=Saccharothrix TaxID=2071 RepID=UPI000939FC12|nr:hypothetical protein [Saccharothrix sp. CB00851]OKI38669.1 hypothetical protein A6A25_00105 [Saccharothrix sp. CB00851]
MRGSFSYRDAVKLLGGDTGLVKLVDHASAATVLAMGGIDLLDARTEVVRVGKQVLSSVRERVTGLHRVERTRLLEAAHAVLVITAFFETLDDIGLPFQLKLSAGEQLALAGADRPTSTRKSAHALALLDTPGPLPSPEQAPDAVSTALWDYYQALVAAVIDFLRGFAAWSDLTQDKRDEFVETCLGVPGRAVEHYRALYRRLSLNCPEFAVWTTGIEHAATRTEVRAGLADLRAFLEPLVGAQPPDDRRDALARSHRAVLGRPIVEGDVPSGLVLPTLAQAYVSPRFKVVDADQSADVSRDEWWSAEPVRTDLDDYLAGYLTSSGATTAPLVVLGQPGAGKSLLTKILAARLPPEDFLPIRVVLRDVPADASLQEQVEDAITRATGERLTWPELARAAAPAVPVVLLDGFDELLQATGTSKSDYLARIREFQQREADQGRAVIFVLTSRTAVANRARFAGPTKVLKLEPFGHDQVRRWLDVWNTANPRAVLAPDVALRFEGLAAQPLLLFMLALYNADGNALHTAGEGLATATLYEQLLTRFARREVAKSLHDALDDQVELAVEEELVRLSVVAFAMFNRGVQWIDETELDDDLNALLPGGPRTGPDRRLRLSSAQLAVGRFFFVHAARAAQDSRVLQTYEFLHATFGEFLVARLVHRVSLDVLAQERAAKSRYGRQGTDAGWLEPVLSFAPLTTRSPVISFLRELFRRTPDADRTELHKLLTALVDTAQHRQPGSDHPDYLPRSLTIAHRIAAYTVNLVTLAVVVGRGYAVSDFPRPEWQSLALLWQSQLGEEEWDSITRVLTVEPSLDAVVLRGWLPPPPVDVVWLLGSAVPARDHAKLAAPNYLDEIRRWEAFRTSWREGLLLHNLEPLMSDLTAALSELVPHEGQWVTPWHLLATVLTSTDPQERVAAYTSVLAALKGGARLDEHYRAMFFDLLARDRATTPLMLKEVVSLGVSSDATTESVVRCALRLLGDAGEQEVDALGLLDDLFAEPDIREFAPHTVARALTCLIELGIELAHVPALEDLPVLLDELDLDVIANTDRHLHVRLRRALESIGMGDHMAR